MKHKLLLSAIFICLHQGSILAQDEDFDMSAFEESSDAKVYCNNKVLGLSPSKLISLSFDFVGSNTWTTSAGPDYTGTFTDSKSDFSRNSGIRLETNYPLISTNRIIFNAYLNYWESHYKFESTESDIAKLFGTHPLRTTVLGAVVFKPLDEKKFLIIQAEGALNGNYNFMDISPDLGKTKIGGSFLYGWKRNDNTNIAIGVTRTFRGGRALHIPVVLWNKTFNSKWGIEALFPARGAVRRNFSAKSLMMIGYELEGQSYHLQTNNGSASPFFGSSSTANDWELRKSEIRARLSWDKAITDFVWFNVQVGAVINYRVDIDQAADANESWLSNDLGIPLYLRFGIQLVSP